MGLESARARKSYGKFNERHWVRRPTAMKEIQDAKGTAKGCALAIGVPPSTFQTWFLQNKPECQKHPDWIPKEVSVGIDKYLADLRRVSQGGSPPGATEIDGPVTQRPLVALHDEGVQNHYSELVRMELRRDNRPPQPEGDPIAIGYHINARTDWLYQAKNRRIAIREFAIKMVADQGHVGEFRKPAKPSKLAGVKLTIDGVRSELRADFTVDDPQKEHVELNGLHEAIALASYERGRAGDRLTVELFVNLDHGFTCVRTPDDAPAPPRTPRKFREKVIEHLSKRALLGDLAEAQFVTLCMQVLRIEPEREETP